MFNSEDENKSVHVYDKMSEEYGYDIYASFASRLKYDLAIKYCHKDAIVLDAGCANGLYAVAIARHCRQVIGIDISKDMLEKASAKARELRIDNSLFENKNILLTNYQSESFDLVFSFSTLFWVSEPRKAINEISRILKVNGVAILDIAGRYNLSQVYWRYYYRKKGYLVGLEAFSYKEIRNLLADSGLNIVEKHALGFTDQWKYVPGLHKLKFLETFFHHPGEEDLDYRISNLSSIFPLANRWYLVCRKTS